MTKVPKNYIGILDGGGKVWGVRFPDIDGCVGGGATPEAAIADATKALRDVLAHKQSSGAAIPKASSIAEIVKCEKLLRGESIVIVPVVLDAGRTVRANLTLDAGLLDAIDTAAKRAGVTRSAFIAGAAREKLDA
ncbi:MAG: type II toxin-antitoxin system HicB family antitoxin [Aestuariivirga sp.]